MELSIIFQQCFKNEGDISHKINTFSNTQKLGEFVLSRPILQDDIEIFWAESK